MARSTPGYCTLTATRRPSGITARWTWPIDAAATGTGSHWRKRASGSVAELVDHDLLGQARSHRRHVLLQLGKASWAAGGRPSATNPTICPSFIAAPFI